MTITETLDAIEQRADSATPEPWIPTPDGFRVFAKNGTGGELVPALCATNGNNRTKKARLNTVFIAEARQDVPKLVAALRHALDVAGKMRQGSHQDRIIRYGDMIGKIAGILASQTDEGLPVDLNEPCANCGWPHGHHRAISDQCPVSEHHVKWRETKFEHCRRAQVRCLQCLQMHEWGTLCQTCHPDTDAPAA